MLERSAVSKTGKRQWLVGLFQAGGLEDTLSRLRDSSLEGAVGRVPDGAVVEVFWVVLAGCSVGLCWLGVWSGWLGDLPVDGFLRRAGASCELRSVVLEKMSVPPCPSGRDGTRMLKRCRVRCQEMLILRGLDSCRFGTSMVSTPSRIWAFTSSGEPALGSGKARKKWPYERSIR